MKHFIISIASVLIVMLSTSFSGQALNPKSYSVRQIGSRMPGQVPEVPINSWMIMYFSDDNKSIFMVDGTNWKYTGTNMYGNHRYVFDGFTGNKGMPFTQYQEMITTSDFSMVEVHYLFGMPGMMAPMYIQYAFFCDGAEAAQSAMEEQNGGGNFGRLL